MLTDKQEMFCREYIIDFNATQAAIRAGYSSTSARQVGFDNMTKHDIQSRIKELIEERNSRVQVDADYVLKQAVKLHERCMQEVRPKTIRGEQVKDEEGNNVFVFDSMGAAKSLELIGKHVSVKAWEDKINLSGDVNIIWNEEKTYEAKPQTDYND